MTGGGGRGGLIYYFGGGNCCCPAFGGFAYTFCFSGWESALIGYGLLSLGCSTGLGDIAGICFGVYDFGCSGLFVVFGFDVWVCCLRAGNELWRETYVGCKLVETGGFSCVGTFWGEFNLFYWGFSSYFLASPVGSKWLFAGKFIFDISYKVGTGVSVWTGFYTWCYEEAFLYLD